MNSAVHLPALFLAPRFTPADLPSTVMFQLPAPRPVSCDVRPSAFSSTYRASESTRVRARSCLFKRTEKVKEPRATCRLIAGRSSPTRPFLPAPVAPASPSALVNSVASASACSTPETPKAPVLVSRTLPGPSIIPLVLTFVTVPIIRVFV